MLKSTYEAVRLLTLRFIFYSFILFYFIMSLGVFIGTETKHDSLTHDDCTRWSVKLLHATAAEGDQLEGLLLLQGFVIIKQNI